MRSSTKSKAVTHRTTTGETGSGLESAAVATGTGRELDERAARNRKLLVDNDNTGPHFGHGELI